MVDSPSEKNVARRMTMPQDIRYATEPTEQEKLVEKFMNYVVSETKTSFIRFLIDRRQKNLLFNSNEFNVEKFDVTIENGYQQPTKHSFKLSGIEKNVRLCLIDLFNRIFVEKSPKDDEEVETTNVFVTTINPDASVTEETKTVEPEDLKYVPIERKPEFTFILLINSQGQEVLKKNWSFFGGSLQQRLNIVVASPVRLPKFGDKNVFYELSITGESIENLADASLQINAFINDVLGVTLTPSATEENPLRSKQRQSAPPSTSTLNQSDRTFVNRNRGEIFEEKLLIRSDCVARIVGKRGANLRLIKNKSHLIEFDVGREPNEEGYVQCRLTATQLRNIQTAIDTIRNFLRREDSNAVIVVESTDRSTPISAFSTTSFQIDSSKFAQPPSYNFQNPPSFDFTHQATCAARKNDKRPGELTEIEPKILLSPQHQSKRTCPETKEITCSTDEGFWIQKQFYHALDDESKQLFDSLIDKLDKIRLATEENAARKHQRLAGRNRSTKTRVCSSSISQLNDENLPTKSISNEEKENQSEKTNE